MRLQASAIQRKTDDAMRTLLIAPAWVGDMVMAEPLVRLLHAQQPAAEIHVAAPRSTRPLALRMQHVAATHDWPFAHGVFDLALRWRLAQRLRGLQFERVLVLPNSWKSALVPFLAGIPKRVGFVGEARYGLLNDARQLRAAELPMMVQRFLALGRPADAPTPSAAVPQLQPDAAQSARLRQACAGDGTARVLALCPGAEFGASKRWPGAHFADIASTFIARGWQVWLFGAEKDVQVGAEIADSIAQARRHNLVSLIGRTSLLDAIDLLACADAVVSNDSGLMHVAAALGRPVVGVFGSTSERFTPPLGAHTRSISIPLPCRPCFERTCRFGHYDCLQKLAPAIVLAKLDQLLEGA